MKFGTDGVRGSAGVELTAEFALALARASARVLGPEAVAANPSVVPTVVIGGDTRESTPMFAAALAAGFMSEGVDVIDIGVATTPLVAFEAQRLGAIGAVVSASHNAWHDNGIKLFAPGGTKLSDDVQHRIEAELVRAESAGGPPSGSLTGPSSGPSIGSAVGSPLGSGRIGVRHHPSGADLDAYVSHVAGLLDGRRLDGVRVVLDCAHGAGRDAPAVLRALGADVIVLANDPDGRNINAGVGATHPGHVATAVVEHGADAGIALDGDADRLIAVDGAGRVVDGDHVIAICAADLRARGALRHDTVVVTVMTNLGFRLAMGEAGIDVVETAVGDRYVLEALAAGGYSLGGEQSGHVVFADHATTGDGVLTAVALLDVVHRSGTTLAELAAGAMTALPQVLVNVAVAERAPDVAERLADEIAAVGARLGDTGRVLVRASGTEPLVRVMVEAPTEAAAHAAADELAAAVRARLG